MFDILFGWRKASKCKKLIKTVQCRLKLLKSKRCCIVKQLREDVAELLKHGHHQTAFGRVEQLVMDEIMVQAYDLLDQFCEFIILHIPYIRKHKDCPNDINEAISTLIFSSARFGELPELLLIRKLFGERYGQRFVMATLELLPGNLVNRQIKENLYLKKVPDDVKYRLLDEIAGSCVQTGPLFLEYKPELQEEQEIKHSSSKRSCSEDYIGEEIEGEVIYFDLSSEKKKISEEPYLGLGKDYILPNEIQDSDPGGEKIMKPVDCNEIENSTISHHESLKWGSTGETLESCSENSANMPEEMIHLDDIEEFVSPAVSKDGNLQDQRLFMFKSFENPLNKKPDYGIHINLEERKLFQEKFVPRKMRKTSRKRSKRRSIRQENRNVTASDCKITYYGVSDETSPDTKCKSHCYQPEHWTKIVAQESQKLYAKKCSLGHPFYFPGTDETEGLESACWTPKLKSSKTQDFTVHSIKEGKIQPGLQFCKYSYRGGPEETRVGEQTQPPSLRAMTTPLERPKESTTENIFRSNSFPFDQQPHSGYSSCRHIHPKLPDYDELAAKFKALKRAKHQNKQQQSNP